MQNEILLSGQFHTHTCMLFDGRGGEESHVAIWFLEHIIIVLAFINACRLLSALPSLSRFGQGRLSLVAISFYALSLLFGPCCLSEFTLPGPLLLWHVSLTLCDNIPLNMSEDSTFKDIHNYNTWKKNNILRHQSCRSWGQNRFAYQAANDWNILSIKWS